MPCNQAIDYGLGAVLCVPSPSQTPGFCGTGRKVGDRVTYCSVNSLRSPLPKGYRIPT